MAQYAKENLPHVTEITVSSFHSFMKNALNQDTHDKTTKDVCAMFHANADDITSAKYDVLVVDEAQDLMLPEFWDCIDFFIFGGLEKGEWAAFTDPNQSIFNDENDYELGYEYLMELYSPYSMVLNKNWRNTAQIARRTSRLCNVPPAKYMKIDGPRVEKRTFSNKPEFIKMFKDDVRSLIAGGVSPSDIIILSQRKLGNSYLADMTEYCGLKLSEMSDLSSLKSKQLNYATVQSYKGLESNVVLYINIEGFKSKESRKMNYVGMSRAKELLYMYVCDDYQDEYDFMMDESV